MYSTEYVCTYSDLRRRNSFIESIGTVNYGCNADGCWHNYVLVFEKGETIEALQGARGSMVPG